MAAQRLATLTLNCTAYGWCVGVHVRSALAPKKRSQSVACELRLIRRTQVAPATAVPCLNHHYVRAVQEVWNLSISKRCLNAHCHRHCLPRLQLGPETIDKRAVQLKMNFL